MGKWTKRLFGVIGILAVAAVLNGLLRPLQEHFPVTIGASPYAPPSDVDDRPFVGLALSGGGARAAAFAAGGIEALAEHVPLAEITHVSSVSGGGFAASYLATRAHNDCSAPYDKAACVEYFDNMRAVAAPSSMWGIEKYQILDPRRVLSPSRRLNSLQDVLNSPDFLADKTFTELDEGKTWFFNAVSYDNGRPFVFSNGTLPPAERAATTVVPDSIRSLTFSDKTTLRPAPTDLPISLAVATSAAFPPYLGPTTLTINGGEEYWHLGDGGIVENTGVATLREALHARGGNERAVIYSFDAGQRLDSEESLKTLDLSIWTTQITRTVDVLNGYAGGYREELLDALDLQAGIDVEVIEFDYLDVNLMVSDYDVAVPAATRAKWENWDWWQDTYGCGQRTQTPAAYLANVPTRLSISDCNKGLISEAAKFLVMMRFANIP